jgi:hypothetical protein
VDVYSFGISMWVICYGTGEHPYTDIPPFSISDFVHQGGRPLPNPAWPSRLTRLMQQCWEGEPDKRPSFTEILSELQEIQVEYDPGVSQAHITQDEEQGEKARASYQWHSLPF